MKILGKMQRRATIWILGAFKTSPLFSVEAIAGLIPINLYLQKLSGRSQLCAHSLPKQPHPPFPYETKISHSIQIPYVVFWLSFKIAT